MFANRIDAGEQLANALKGLSLPENILVLGIPRGGVVVAAVIAQRLHAPLGHILVKKIGAPYNPELAIGAVGEGDIVYWDQEVVARQHVSPDAKRLLKDRTYQTILEREQQFGSWYQRPDVSSKTVLLIDDGVATGATAICAAEIAKHYGAQHVFLVTPIIPTSVVPMLRQYVTEIISLQVSDMFGSVGQYYASFPDVSDEEVQLLLSTSEKLQQSLADVV